MNGSAHMNSSGFSDGISTQPRRAIQSDLRQPVFSPAVRFAPQEPSLLQLIRLVAYWVSIIAIALIMARSGFSYLHQVWSDRPGHHSVK
jgi:hypothetical protein